MQPPLRVVTAIGLAIFFIGAIWSTVVVAKMNKILKAKYPKRRHPRFVLSYFAKNTVVREYSATIGHDRLYKRLQQQNRLMYFAYALFALVAIADHTLGK